MSERNGKLVGALVGGIRIMRYLNAATEPVGVNRVARDLALNPSTAYNLLRTLVYERLAVFDPERKTYAPGPGLADLGAGMQDFTAHIRLVRAHLRDLAARNDVTAILWHRSDDEHAVLIDGVESPANVHIRMDLGQRLPLFVGAMGRCFAAHEGLGREALRERFSHLRWQTPLSFDDYEKGVEAVRRQGYAVDTGDFAQGVTIVSAPIL
ncbi:MAG TPA: helix-turn-helix domain-containing protein, partial [Alphaproteobacteria bacterium]|nr:helix-turn-helix domain-containing protein [Alphaproteobacteria bacterium]